MNSPALTLEEALGLLREESPQQDVQADDPRSLIREVVALASHETREIVSNVGEALLAHEMESLSWQPLAAARLILVLLDRASPSSNLMELSLNYLSMYFQELDDVIGVCRSRIATGESLSDVASSLVQALQRVDGVLFGDIDIP